MPTLFSSSVAATDDYLVHVADSDKAPLFALLDLPVATTGTVHPSDLQERIADAMRSINSDISDDPTRQEETVRTARVAYALGGLYSLSVEALQAGVEITWK